MFLPIDQVVPRPRNAGGQDEGRDE